MTMIAIQRPNFSRRWRCGTAGYRRLNRASIVRCARKGQECLEPKIKNFSSSKVIFNRLQVSVEDEAKLGQFMVREARVYQEYWTAAWLRAESHWEDRESEGCAVNTRREFAQQEYNAMTRRYNANMGENCKCVVMVQNGGVVGTLDLSIQHFRHGQTFPGELLKHPLVWLMERKASIWYAYIANLCVAKSARRQGVATCMLQYAISTAKANGAQKVFVHVHRHNKPARDLYQKIGFQIVDGATLQLSEEQTYLLCFEVSSSYEHSFSM